MLKIKKIILLGLTVFGLIGLSGTALADSGSTSLSASGGTYAIGTTFSVPVYENSGDTQVNVVQANMNYDSSKLELISIDTGQSGFNVKVSESGGSGAVKITRGSTSPVTGSVLLATLMFKAMSDSGSSQLTFVNSQSSSSGTFVIAAGPSPAEIWDKNTLGATFTFTPPPVTVPNPPVNPAAGSTTKPPVTSAKTEIRPAADSVLATNAKLPTKPLPAPLYEDNSKNWWAFIGLCGLTVIGLLARLFNLHKKIRARSPLTFLFQALKKAV
jgi:hypothetical protein